MSHRHLPVTVHGTLVDLPSHLTSHCSRHSRDVTTSYQQWSRNKIIMKSANTSMAAMSGHHQGATLVKAPHQVVGHVAPPFSADVRSISPQAVLQNINLWWPHYQLAARRRRLVSASCHARMSHHLLIQARSPPAVAVPFLAMNDCSASNSTFGVISRRDHRTSSS